MKHLWKVKTRSGAPMQKGVVSRGWIVMADSVHEAQAVGGGLLVREWIMRGRDEVLLSVETEELPEGAYLAFVHTDRATPEEWVDLRQPRAPLSAGYHPPTTAPGSPASPVPAPPAAPRRSRAARRPRGSSR